MTIDEAAKVYGLKPSTVYSKIRLHGVEPVGKRQSEKPGRNPFVYPRADVDAAMRAPDKRTLRVGPCCATRYKEMRAMRDDGASFAAIGARFGVTGQAVQQYLANHERLTHDK